MKIKFFDENNLVFEEELNEIFFKEIPFVKLAKEFELIDLPSNYYENSKDGANLRMNYRIDNNIKKLVIKKIEDKEKLFYNIDDDIINDQLAKILKEFNLDSNLIKLNSKEIDDLNNIINYIDLYSILSEEILNNEIKKPIIYIEY